MKSVYSAVRTGSLNKAVCASSLNGCYHGEERRGSFNNALELQSISYSCQQYKHTYVFIKSARHFCPSLTSFGVSRQNFVKVLN